MTVDTLSNAPDRKLAKAVKESKAPAISRAAAILRLLGKSDTPLALQTIARTLDLVPSTCLYVLRALVAEEFVAFDPDTKRYSLEAGVLTLARHWLKRNQFNDVAQPILDRISRNFDVTTLGVHIVGLDRMIVVAAAQSNNNFHLSAQVGSRFPALISATGRCIAAFGNYSLKDLEERFDTLRWDDPPTFEQWLDEVEIVRNQGFASDQGNYIAGVTVLSAPVWKTTAKLSHALVAIGLSSAVKRTGIEELQEALLTSAKQLTNQLCGEN